MADLSSLRRFSDSVSTRLGGRTYTFTSTSLVALESDSAAVADGGDTGVTVPVDARRSDRRLVPPKLESTRAAGGSDASVLTSVSAVCSSVRSTTMVLPISSGQTTASPSGMGVAMGDRGSRGDIGERGGGGPAGGKRGGTGGVSGTRDETAGGVVGDSGESGWRGVVGGERGANVLLSTLWSDGLLTTQRERTLALESALATC